MAQSVCLVVAAGDRARLEAIVADRNRPQKHVTRARLVLLSADRLDVARWRAGPGSGGRRSGAGSGATPRRAWTASCATRPGSPARLLWAMTWCAGWWR